MKILIVEDSYVARSLLHELLQQYGTVDVTSNGQDAIEQLKNGWREQQPYDLLFLDIMMPQINGHQVLNYLRREEKKQAQQVSRVVMTSALNDSKNVLECFREGADCYLTKPIKPSKVKQILEDLGIFQETSTCR